MNVLNYIDYVANEMADHSEEVRMQNEMSLT
jgi:hypothetical protein